MEKFNVEINVKLIYINSAAVGILRYFLDT